MDVLRGHVHGQGGLLGAEGEGHRDQAVARDGLRVVADGEAEVELGMAGEDVGRERGTTTRSAR
jgi:hypothetical protein